MVYLGHAFFCEFLLVWYHILSLISIRRICFYLQYMNKVSNPISKYKSVKKCTAVKLSFFCPLNSCTVQYIFHTPFFKSIPWSPIDGDMEIYVIEHQEIGGRGGWRVIQMFVWGWGGFVFWEEEWCCFCFFLGLGGAGCFSCRCGNLNSKRVDKNVIGRGCGLHVSVAIRPNATRIYTVYTYTSKSF